MCPPSACPFLNLLSHILQHWSVSRSSSKGSRTALLDLALGSAFALVCDRSFAVAAATAFFTAAPVALRARLRGLLAPFFEAGGFACFARDFLAPPGGGLLGDGDGVVRSGLATIPLRPRGSSTSISRLRFSARSCVCCRRRRAASLRSPREWRREEVLDSRDMGTAENSESPLLFFSRKRRGVGHCRS